MCASLLMSPLLLIFCLNLVVFNQCFPCDSRLGLRSLASPISSSFGHFFKDSSQKRDNFLSQTSQWLWVWIKCLLFHSRFQRCDPFISPCIWISWFWFMYRVNLFFHILLHRPPRLLSHLHQVLTLSAWSRIYG